MGSMSDDLQIALSDGVLTLTLDRPSSANALGPALVEALIGALDDAPAETRVLVIRGSGAHFCAGFDLGGLDTLSDGDLLLRFVRIETLLQRVFHAPFPTVALAQGRAIGAGADLFAACALRIAAPGTLFRMPGWRFGIALGTRRLASRIGSEAARDMLLGSRAVAAEQALDLGLVHDIATEDHWPEAVARARDLAATLTSRSVADLMTLTAVDTRAADMAALVETASRPGLKQRMIAYRDAMPRTRKSGRA
jgi:enoyl-CoA hydratase/carnithine racemase